MPSPKTLQEIQRFLTIVGIALIAVHLITNTILYWPLFLIDTTFGETSISGVATMIIGLFAWLGSHEVGIACLIAAYVCAKLRGQDSAD